MKNRITKTLRGKAGFTLVELIVVIAILGILAGVGTVGYSGYIKKANQAADEQLIASVKNALQLGAIGNFGQNDSGYVVLSTSAAPSVADNTIGGVSTEAYLKAAFGDDFSGLVLKSDWEMNKGFLDAALNSNGAAAVGSSTYLTKSSVPELLGNVQTVTSSAAGLLGTVMKSPEDYVNALKMALGQDYMDEAVKSGIMEKSGTGDTAVYTLTNATTDGNGKLVVSEELETQLSNLMVLSVAKELQNADTATMQQLMTHSYTGTEYSPAAILAARYALYQAYSIETGDTTAFDVMNSSLGSATKLSEATKALDDFLNSNQAGLIDYTIDMDQSMAQGSNVYYDGFTTNADAITAIMKGVSSVSDKYNNAETLKTTGLYTSEKVANDLNSYINVAAFAGNLSGLTEEQKNVLSGVENGVLISISADGNGVCSVYSTTDGIN